MPDCCLQCEHFYYKDDKGKCLLLKKKNEITNFFGRKDNCPIKEE